jgi:hypothetical protein
MEGIELGGVVYISSGINYKSVNVVAMTLSDNKKYLEASLQPILNTLVLNL